MIGFNTETIGSNIIGCRPTMYKETTMKKLDGKVAIVTGASRGIGSGIAKKFAEEGARVTINYNNSEKEANSLLNDIEREGGEAILSRADVSRRDDVKEMVRKTMESWNRVDILVNNAGVLHTVDFLETTEEIWDNTMSVNLKGAYLCCKEVAPIMLEQKKGKIINISSNSGMYHPSAMQFAEYVASKAGLNGLTKALALRLGPYIEVNAICPGAIATEMTTYRDNTANQNLINETPLKRLGSVEDVANAALFLASNDSDFITGELMLVTGGRGMHQ